MKLDNKLPLDPNDLRSVFHRDGLALDLLAKCNSQQFRFIGEAGEGYFLFPSTYDFSVNAEVDLVITDSTSGTTQTHLVHILDIVKLNHPDQTDTYYQVVHTMEEKYLQQLTSVARNYNLVDRSTITNPATPPTIKSPDTTPMSLEDILGDIAGVTVNYTASAITPREVNIQGYSTFDAIDLLCRAFGMFWTQKSGQLYVFDGSFVIDPTKVQLADIRKCELEPRLTNFSMVSPVLSAGTQINSRLSVNSRNTNSLGEALTVYNPFNPAFFTTGAVQVDAAGTEAIADTCLDHFDGIVQLLDTYWAYHRYLIDYLQGTIDDTPAYVITYADYGAGPRTLLSSKIYPFLSIPSPYHFDGSSSSGSGQTIIAVYSLTASLAKTVGATATASVIETNDPANPATITVKNAGEYLGYSGAKGIAIKVETTTPGVFEWKVVQQNQPALFVHAMLDANPGSSIGAVKYGADPREAGELAYIKSSPAPTAVTPYPFSHLPTIGTSVKNPKDLFGEDGDLCMLQWDRATDAYFLSAVYPQRQLRQWVTLNEDVSNNIDDTVVCNFQAPCGPGTIAVSTFNVVDIHNVIPHGVSGNQALVEWQPPRNGFTTGRYIFISGEHKATQIRGTIKTFASGAAPATFVIENTVGLDGAWSGDTTVQNVYNWTDGSVGNLVRVEWDQEEGHWRPLQMECDT